VNHVLLVRIIQRQRNLADRGQGFGERQQFIGLRPDFQAIAFEQFHRDISQIVFFADIKHSHDLRVTQATCGFGFAEETGARFIKLGCFEFFGKRHGLDRDFATELGIAAQIDHAHRALAQFTFQLIAAQHRFFHRTVGQNARAVLRTAAQHHGFRHGLRALALGFDIAEIRRKRKQIVVNRLRFVELAATFKIERQIVKRLTGFFIFGHAAQLVESQIELPLALKGQRQHAIRFSRSRARRFLARLGQEMAFGGQRQMSQ